ncbi:MAG: hypothetical protein ACOC7R_04375 [Planctomycetota bacterium]
MDVVLKLLGGAAVGGAVGFFLSRARDCAGGACATGHRGKLMTAVSVLGGAVFGAAVAWWAMHR